MKHLIQLILNLVPRKFLQRIASWAVPAVGIFYMGRGRECPICGSRYRRFMPYGYAIKWFTLNISYYLPIVSFTRN